MIFANASSLAIQSRTYIFAAILFGILILAHGCHPHEDNELFTAWSAW